MLTNVSQRLQAYRAQGVLFIQKTRKKAGPLSDRRSTVRYGLTFAVNVVENGGLSPKKSVTVNVMV
jgi:hypothetical protein